MDTFNAMVQALQPKDNDHRTVEEKLKPVLSAESAKKLAELRAKVDELLALGGEW